MKYLQDSSAFSRVSTFVILSKGELVSKVLVSYPRDGAGKLTAEVTNFGSDILQGTASGYGYSKLDAALAGLTVAGILLIDSGTSWENQLREKGLTVFQVC